MLSPLIFPALVTGLALLQLLSPMGSGESRINLLIGHIVVTAPYVIRTVITSLLLVDLNLEDAARTLGASRLTTSGASPCRRSRRASRPARCSPSWCRSTTSRCRCGSPNAQYSPVPLLLMHQLVNVFDPSVPAMSTMMIILAWSACSSSSVSVGLRRAAAM